ncbi:SDR family NAD(P)-dependent oxidoreductase [Streptomyces sp. NBC_01378]|uniref:SDR family NAD(P)-dependent oxidoreductase n=1 Tax=Streptomyces sp. NBC_01378 TaxID=2903844 RepID=UPI00386EA868
MKTILIAGGNSGIGRQAARDLLADGHRVVLMGRDQRKGEAALASFGNQADRASFVAANLSTHAGVRDAARRMLDQQDGIDALVHSTGVLTLQESRTADGLHPFFAVNYLSRYHLTQLLLPVLRQAERPVVVMMTAAIPPTDDTDFARFPEFTAFDLGRDRKAVQLGNHHYAAHLTSPDRHRTRPRRRRGERGCRQDRHHAHRALVHESRHQDPRASHLRLCRDLRTQRRGSSPARRLADARSTGASPAVSSSARRSCSTPRSPGASWTSPGPSPAPDIRAAVLPPAARPAWAAALPVPWL